MTTVNHRGNAKSPSAAGSRLKRTERLGCTRASDWTCDRVATLEFINTSVTLKQVKKLTSF